MVLEWQMGHVGWTLLILTALLFTGRVFSQRLHPGPCISEGVG
jgi:hypothetical protein